MGTKYYDFTYINEPEHQRIELVPETSRFLDQIDEALHAISGEVDGIASLDSVVDGENVKIRGLDSAGGVLSEVTIKIPNCVKSLEVAKDGDTVTISGKDDAGEVITTATFEASGYTLPIASASTLGGVKIGDGISVADDGTISASGGGSYTLPIASASTLGGVKVGDNLKIDGDGKLSTDINIVAPLKGDTGAVAGGATCLAVGDGAQAEELGSTGKSTAVGAASFATWSLTGSTAIGYNARAQHYNTLALGGATTASGENACAIGAESTADGWGATAIGYQSHAPGSSAVAVGRAASASRDGDIVIGPGSSGSTSGYGSIVIGNDIEEAPYSGILMFSGYTSNTQRSFAGVGPSVVMLANETAGKPIANASNAVIIGSGSVVGSSRYGICIGHEAKNGNGSESITANIAIGSGAKAGADGEAAQCVAIGDNAEASEANTVSFGSSSRKPRIVNVGAPTADNDAATKAYVDASAGSVVTPVNIALTPASGVDVTLNSLGAWSTGSLRAGCILGISNKTENPITISGNATFATLGEALEGSQVSRTFDMTAGELGPVLAVASNGTDLSLSQDVTIAANAAVVLQILEEVL